jgi:hypothetical protein
VPNGSEPSGSTTHATDPADRCVRGSVHTGSVHEATTFGANRATTGHVETPIPVAHSITSGLQRLAVTEQRPTVKPVVQVAGRKLHQRRKSDSSGKSSKTIDFYYKILIQLCKREDDVE